MDSIPDPASSTGVAAAPDGRYRILCLDGGGIRGALSAALLGLLEQAVPGFLSRVNLFAGTSTGGLIALGLAHGLSPQQCLDLYVKQGGGIFPRTWWRRYGLGWLENFWRSRYSNKRLEAELKAQFGPVRLADLRPVLITSFDLNGEYKRNGQYTGIRSWKPKFFHNFANDPSGADGTESAVEVALRTSAAPTYFPSRSTFVDGGVVANNPSVCALAQACHVGLKADQVVMLSVGTGMNPKFVEAENAMWGWFR